MKRIFTSFLLAVICAVACAPVHADTNEYKCGECMAKVHANNPNANKEKLYNLIETACTSGGDSICTADLKTICICGSLHWNLDGGKCSLPSAGQECDCPKGSHGSSCKVSPDGKNCMPTACSGALYTLVDNRCVQKASKEATQQRKKEKAEEKAKTCPCGAGGHAKTCKPNADGKCEIVKCDDGYVLDDRKICVTNVCAKDDCTKLDKNATKCTRSVYNTCDKIVECDKKTSELKDNKCELKHKNGEKCKCTRDIEHGICTYDKNNKCVFSDCEDGWTKSETQLQCDSNEQVACLKFQGATWSEHDKKCTCPADGVPDANNKTCSQRKHEENSECKCTDKNAAKCIYQRDVCVIADKGCKGGYATSGTGEKRTCVENKKAGDLKKICEDSLGTWTADNKCSCDEKTMEFANKKQDSCKFKTNVECGTIYKDVGGDRCDWYARKTKNSTYIQQKIVKCKDADKIPSADGDNCEQSPQAVAINNMNESLQALGSAFETKIAGFPE